MRVKIKSRTPRSVLLELKWRDGCVLGKAEIWYLHRGAPGDTMVITGGELAALGRSFFDTKTASIPYHRILTYSPP